MMEHVFVELVDTDTTPTLRQTVGRLYVDIVCITLHSRAITDHSVK